MGSGAGRDARGRGRRDTRLFHGTWRNSVSLLFGHLICSYILKNSGARRHRQRDARPPFETTRVREHRQTDASGGVGYHTHRASTSNSESCLGLAATREPFVRLASWLRHCARPGERRCAGNVSVAVWGRPVRSLAARAVRDGRHACGACETWCERDMNVCVRSARPLTWTRATPRWRRNPLAPPLAAPRGGWLPCRCRRAGAAVPVPRWLARCGWPAVAGRLVVRVACAVVHVQCRASVRSRAPLCAQAVMIAAALRSTQRTRWLLCSLT